MAEAPDLLSAALVEVGAEIDRAFDSLLSVPSDPRARLYEAMRYSAIGGGLGILGLAFEAFFRVLGHSTQLERNVGDIVRALQVGERWREDVRAATGPLSLGREAESLTLRIPRGTGQITYAFRQGALSREETPGGGPVEVLGNVAGSVFHRDQRRHVAAWRWELELQGKQKVSRVRPLFTFQAVARSETKP